MMTRAEITRAYRARDPEKTRAQRRIESRKYREKYPEKVRAKARDWYAKNREFWKAKAKAYRESHVEERREYNRKNRDRAYMRMILTKYGVTAEMYLQMLHAQGGVCAICKGPPTRESGRYVVDHCHESLKVRGLLCNACNVGLGSFRDSVSIAESAIDYLKRNA